MYFAFLVHQEIRRCDKMRYLHVCECDVYECVYTCRFTSSLSSDATVVCMREIQNTGCDGEHARVRRLIKMSPCWRWTAYIAADPTRRVSAYREIVKTRACTIPVGMPLVALPTFASQYTFWSAQATISPPSRCP